MPLDLTFHDLTYTLSRRCPWAITKLLWNNKVAALEHPPEQEEKLELCFDYSTP